MNKYEHLLGYLEHATFPMEYEAHETLKELFQRATPMKPILRNLSVEYDCPNCAKYVGWVFENYSFCPYCGQAIDWSETK